MALFIYRHKVHWRYYCNTHRKKDRKFWCSAYTLAVRVADGSNSSMSLSQSAKFFLTPRTTITPWSSWMARLRWISGETQGFAEPCRHTWLWKHPGLRSRQYWATKMWTQLRNLILRFPNSHLRTLRRYTPNARPRQCGDLQTNSTGSIFVTSAANHMVLKKLFVCTLNWSTKKIRQDDSNRQRLDHWILLILIRVFNWTDVLYFIRFTLFRANRRIR